MSAQKIVLGDLKTINLQLINRVENGFIPVSIFPAGSRGDTFGLVLEKTTKKFKKVYASYCSDPAKMLEKGSLILGSLWDYFRRETLFVFGEV